MVGVELMVAWRVCQGLKLEAHRHWKGVELEVQRNQMGFVSHHNVYLAEHDQKPSSV